MCARLRMEESRFDEEGVEDDGMMLSEEDILQVIELGDNQPINGNSSVKIQCAAMLLYVKPCCYVQIPV